MVRQGKHPDNDEEDEMNNNNYSGWFLAEVDDDGNVFDDSCAVAPGRYFADADHDGDAQPALHAALDELIGYFPTRSGASATTAITPRPTPAPPGGFLVVPHHDTTSRRRPGRHAHGCG
ncbi:hypothetical protein [Nocardia terpenica]|nr:hypothetical protein [Nocardia terpenica]NQE88501.1 hypothetical protein [Nocardia terpenica]